MKNTIKRSLTYSIFALGCIFAFATCQLVEITENAKITCPDLNQNPSGTGIIVTLKNSIQDIEYINVYRQEVTGYPNESDSTFPIENIGLVFPSKNNTTFVYPDDYICKNKIYRYYVRLYDKQEGYTLSNWTAGMTPQNGYNDPETLKYSKGTNTKLIYNSNDKKLTISGPIVAPSAIDNFDEKFKPALVFSCENGTQAVTFISDTENQTPIHDGNEIHLLEILPSNFFNTDLEIKGLVAQFEKFGDDDDLQRVVWTELLSIPVYDTDDRQIADNKIVIEVKYGAQGYDYSSSL